MDISALPTFSQRQDSVVEQLADLKIIANRFGMYDAADAIGQWCKNLPTLLYGCYCDLEPGMTPDECVIEIGDIKGCIYAKTGMRKEQCKYWKIL